LSVPPITNEANRLLYRLLTIAQHLMVDAKTDTTEHLHKYSSMPNYILKYLLLYCRGDNVWIAPNHITQQQLTTIH